jgi:Zn-dependent M28 family amino/carboxypeptidase
MTEAADLRRRLEGHVRTLAGSIGERHLGRPRAMDEAASYIARILGEQGGVVVPQEFAAAGQLTRNLEVAVSGEVGTPLVVVGAHYDTVPGSPGADDNASGVAAVLEIARLLAGTRPARGVRCVLFANEEPPWFQTGDMGSLHYARRLRERGEEVTAMLSLESIGYYAQAAGSQRYPFPLALAYPDTGNFLGFVSDLGSRALLRAAADSFARHTPFPAQRVAVPGWVAGVSWSDQWAFWQHGFPAVMVTDTAPFRYPAYHTPADTPEQLDYEALATVTGALAAVVLDLASV